MSYNLIFPYVADGKSPALVHINTETGLGSTITNANDYWPKSCVPYNGKLYFGAGNTLKEFDPTTEVIRNLGNSGDSNIYAGRAAPDGVLFFGTHDEGRLCSYNTNTDTFTDHGRMDENGPSYQYGYSIAADNNYVYVGLGQSPWYLGVYNRNSEEKTLYFKESGTSGSISVGTDESIWWGGYKMIDGVPTSGQPAVAKIGAHEQSGANIDHTTWSDDIGYEVDLSDAIPVGDIPAIIRWKASGAPTWNEYTSDSLPISEQVLKRVYSFDSNRLLLITAAYGPMALYTVSDGSVEILGWTDKSLYDAVKHSNGKWYLSGYAGITLEWDPTQPWTVSPDNPIQSGVDTNPRYACGIAKYHHYSCVGSDNVVYIGVTHERDSVGASLGWYDPDNPIASAPRIREGLERWYPRGLVSVGDYIVMSAQSMDGLDGELIILDTESKSILGRQIPLPDLDYNNPGFLVSVSSSDVIGIVGDYAYRWNIVTNSLVWQITLPKTAMNNISTIDRRAEIAPDGKIYFFGEAIIYALSPSDGEITAAYNENVQGNVFWHQNQLYVYGNTHLRKEPA